MRLSTYSVNGQRAVRDDCKLADDCQFIADALACLAGNCQFCETVFDRRPRCRCSETHAEPALPKSDRFAEKLGSRT
jgi:hypothetical protein